jgi:hypothetical protein
VFTVDRRQSLGYINECHSSVGSSYEREIVAAESREEIELEVTVSVCDRVLSYELREVKSSGGSTRTDRSEFRSTEEYRRSACEEFACDIQDFMCPVVQWDWMRVI